jgi:hypothetical protein
MARIPLMVAGALAVTALTVTGGGAVAGAATASGSVRAESAQPASAAHAASRSLCRRPAAAGRVVITRTRPGARTRSVTVSQARRTRSLARAVCALPKLPAGTQCPDIAAGFHRLTFVAGHRKLAVVTIQNAGCRLVTGLRTVRQADKAHFWKMIRKLMH